MKILFVCTGNTCRSCMAEAIFNKLCTDQNISAESAGVNIEINSKTSKHAVEVTKSNIEMDLSGRFAVQVTSELLEKADLILTMTLSHKRLLSREFKAYEKKIYTLNEYVGVKGEILDPYGGDIVIYQKTFNNLKDSISLLVDKLKEDRSI